MVKICGGFSRIDFFSKKECAGRTRLIRQEYKPKRLAKIPKLFFKDYLVTQFAFDKKYATKDWTCLDEDYRNSKK